MAVMAEIVHHGLNTTGKFSLGHTIAKHIFFSHHTENKEVPIGPSPGTPGWFQTVISLQVPNEYNPDTFDWEESCQSLPP